MEISQAFISTTSASNKFKLAEDLIKLLNVREKNSGMVEDWIFFISTSNFKVTAGEIYLAFTMALSREILDSNGKEIDLFPELSNNTTGKVISAYLNHKNDNLQYQLAKDKLKALKSPENKITDSEKMQLREDLLKMIYKEIKEDGFCSDAWHIYPDLEGFGRINPTTEEKKKLYKEQLKIYEIEEKALIKTKYDAFIIKTHLKYLADKVSSKTPVESVSNKCRSIIASNYLKDYIDSFENFKNQIK